MLPPLSAPSATVRAAETVEEYRRYPPPELLQLPLRSGGLSSPSLLAALTSPAEPAVPRNGSPASSTATSGPLDSQVGEGRSANSSDEGERNANKAGAYLTASTTVVQEHGEGAEKEGEAEATATAPRSSVHDAAHASITMQLRWGFTAADLRRVYEMHEDALPLSYGPSYYQWLLDHDGCMALVATMPADAFARCTDASTAAPPLPNGEDVPLTWYPGYTPATPAEAAAGPRPVPPPASQRRLTTEVMAERAEVDRCLTELEYIAECQRQKTGTTASASTPSEECGDGDACSSTTEEVVVVGFILGQCAYARHDAGHLLTNPTSYIGSFIVDPRLRHCGLGGALLQRFLTYVTEQRPLYARDYLHYDERKLIAMLAAAQLRKRNDLRTAAEAATANKAAAATRTPTGDVSSSKEEKVVTTTSADESAGGKSALSSTLSQLVAAYFPEASVWWEDRQARQRLRASGLTEAEVDAQRFRDRLAPDALTDEEADEVRHNAEHFLVQTGVREVWLHCLPGNARANLLYARRGFSLHRVLRGYYDVDGEMYDANLLLYAKPVDGAVVAGDADGVLSSAAEMDTVVQQQDALAQLSATAARVGTGEGLRRRRGVGSEAAEEVEEAGAVTRGDTPSAQAATSAAAPRSLAKASWLSTRSYPVVADVVLCTAADGQEEWQRRFGGSGDVTGQRSWWEWVREVLFLVNAMGLFCAVAWLAYNVALTGKVE